MPTQSKNNQNPKQTELTFEEKLQAVTEAYIEYEETLNEIYEDFLIKMSQIRKKDDIRKLESLKLKNKPSNDNK